MRWQVRSLALLSVLTIQCCCEVWCTLETQLGSGVAVAVGHMSAAIAGTRPLAWEPPYAGSPALKSNNNTNNEREKEKGRKEGRKRCMSSVSLEKPDPNPNPNPNTSPLVGPMLISLSTGGQMSSYTHAQLHTYVQVHLSSPASQAVRAL